MATIVYGVYKQARIMEWEKRFLMKIVEQYKWNYSAAARSLSLDRANFLRLINKHKIQRPNADKILNGKNCRCCRKSL